MKKNKTAKNIILILSTVFLLHLTLRLILLPVLIPTFTTNFKRDDFSSEEVKIIEDVYRFKLEENEKIAFAECIHIRDTTVKVTIDGISDKDEFVRRNNLEYKGNVEKDIQRFSDNDSNRVDTEAYEFSLEEHVCLDWYLYKNNGTWSAYLTTSDPLPHNNSWVTNMFTFENSSHNIWDIIKLIL